MSPLRICPTECSVFRIAVCPTCVFCVAPCLHFMCPYFVLYKTMIWPFHFLFSGDHWFCLLSHLGCSRYWMPCTQQKVVEELYCQTCSCNCKDFIFLFNLRYEMKSQVWIVLRYYWRQQNPYTCISSRQQSLEEIKTHFLRSTAFLCTF